MLLVNILNVRLHLEDKGEYSIYEDISIILADNNILTICMYCNNINKLNELYVLNPQIGYSLFKCANSFNLVKLVIYTNKMHLEIALLPFQCEDSDKIVEVAMKQLLFALDKVKKLEVEMIERYGKDTETLKNSLVLDAISKGVNSKDTSGEFIHVNDK